ncbi:MAG: hormogonium polysaccharide biosynthesis acetyltransferase HpsU [Leptolyngbyaceae cyanobacterium bins.59]|nr:hormogonium polysaccharide biosynthesis acetyltransferase HpsU [Leptolyngbyaceae cyanobacterium bins.59]
MSPELKTNAWVDLRRYHQTGYDRGRPGWYVLIWWLVQSVVFPLTPHALHGPRCFLLRLFGARVGKGVVIRPSARFTYPWKVDLGDYCWVGEDATFYSLDRILIGQHAVISQRCYLCTGSHDIQDPDFGLITKPIVVGNGAWVATDCFVGPGVTIGANAVIGARSSVFKDMPAGHICLGSPCQPLRPREMRSVGSNPNPSN